MLLGRAPENSITVSKCEVVARERDLSGSLIKDPISSHGHLIYELLKNLIRVRSIDTDVLTIGGIDQIGVDDLEQCCMLQVWNNDTGITQNAQVLESSFA